MGKEKFEVLLPIIVNDIVKNIMSEKKIGMSIALEILYNSKLYSLLEDEETKLWWYSTPRLIGLLNQELENGVIEFADV